MRGMLAHGRDAVMAATTAADDLCVVDLLSRHERDDRVAVLTDISRLGVVAGFAERIDVVVAADAVAGNVCVIEVCRHPAIRRVAVVAGIAARDVPVVLAHRDRAVVAGATVSQHLSVINAHRGRERYDTMAVLAKICCLYVCNGLADRIDIVMAAHAVGRDVVVVEIGGRPGHRGVAVVACVAAENMSGVLAHRRRAVVAGTAGAEYLQVIDLGYGCKRNNAVAILADTRRRDMRRGLADCIDGVVTARAVARDVVVAEVRRSPGQCAVAVLAGIAAENVTSVFSGRRNTVVTRAAATEHLRVIDARDRCERDDRMAVLADICRQCVRWRLADRRHVVMAIHALAGDVVVVEIGWRPAGGRMAVVAGIAARDMRWMFTDCGRAVMA